MLRRWIVSTFVLLLPLVGIPAAGAVAPGSPADVTEFPLPHADSRPYTIVTGPDGNLWFTESTRSTIGRITPTGTFTEWHTDDDGTGPYGITLGSDGNLWFIDIHLGRTAVELGDGRIGGIGKA